MIVRKFMRLLLVPGMAVPLVLVACSSDDSHFLMDTSLVGAAHSQEGFADQIESAVDGPRNASEIPEVKIVGDSFKFEFGDEGAKGTASVKMTDDNQIDHTLREFNGYDITEKLHTGTNDLRTPAGTLHAVVFTHSKTDDMDSPDGDGTDDKTNHLSFGLWMIEPPEDSMGEKISVGAFGAHGLNLVAHPMKPSNEMTATFSGPSIGVATDDGSSKFFDAMVELKATVNQNTKYILAGKVHNFNGIDMKDIRLMAVELTLTNSAKLLKGVTRLVEDPQNDEGQGTWRAGFTSENSIVGSYGFGSADDKTHLIGSFGAYKDPANANEMNN